MLKKTVTYTDLNGDETTEDLFFHLSQAELVEKEMSTEGGYSDMLQKIVETEDSKQIIAQFKDIILFSYGKRSEDGKRFIKSQQLREEFESSEAYSALFMEIVTNTDFAIEFTRGILPEALIKDATAQIEAATRPEVEQVADAEKEVRIVTKADILAMDQEQLAAFGAAVSLGEAKLAD